MEDALGIENLGGGICDIIENVLGCVYNEKIWKESGTFHVNFIAFL